MKIIIVEDDLKIREELTKLLEQHHYEVIAIDDFENVISSLKEITGDLILLDINLPFENGFEICKKIKEYKSIPILFVTSRNTAEDEIKSIISGGSDFIPKPYNTALLLEKIHRILENNDPIRYKEIMVNDVVLDLHLSLLKYRDREIELTRNEFRILYYFFMNPDRIITKEELIEYLWNDKYYLDENILLVNINRLRKKIEDIGVSEFIKTIRKEGYSL